MMELSFATYNHLIKSQKLYIPTIYLFAKDGTGLEELIEEIIR